MATPSDQTAPSSVIPPNGGMVLAQTTPSPSTWPGMSARLSGLRAEATTWEQQGAELAKVKPTIENAKFTVHHFGPFAEFAQVYDRIRQRTTDLLQQGSERLNEVGGALRTMANRYGQLDDQMRDNYGNVIKAG